MPRRRALAFAATAGAVVIVDQVTKAIVRASFQVGESLPLINGVLSLTRVRNTGAAFGVFAGGRWFFVITAFGVLAAVAWAVVRLRPRSRVLMAGLALVAGGALGNLIDRVALGGVTDFFDLGWWPVFNVADIALDTGVVLIAWWLLFAPEHRSSGRRPDGREADGGGAASASADGGPSGALGQ